MAALAYAIRRKRPAELEIMARAGVILGDCLDQVASLVRPGITTLELDEAAEAFIRDNGCVPSFLGYNGTYPASICVSVNEEAVHGIPGPRVVADGDLVSLDCGLILEGWHSDSGLSVVCGEADEETARLMEATSLALDAGISAAQPGQRIGDISTAIGRVISDHRFSALDGWGGHGIGREMHEPPHVPNQGRPGHGNELKPGLVLALEPIVNAGTAKYLVIDDGWTVVTADGRRSCYFEHTVAITEDGPVVYSRRRSEAAI
jgi:methionyl aminopeptidase